LSERKPKPESITIQLIGREWYSLKNQAKGARMTPEQYIAWVLFRRGHK
jgi:hypothetical protein